MTNLKLTFLTVVVLAFSTCRAQSPEANARNIRVHNIQEKWALLIGVDDYVEANDLKYAGRDMNGLRQRLVASGFPENHVFTLSSQAQEAKLWPFKSNIEYQLDLLLGKLDEEGSTQVKPGLVREGDVVVVALSGHGVHLNDDGVPNLDASYFCPADARLADSSTLVSLKRVYQRLQTCRADLKLILVDACRNDPRPEGSRDLAGSVGTRQFALALQNRPKGILVMSSCAAGQVSWEDAGFRHGVFMNYVLTGLDGAADRRSENAAADEDGQVSLSELFRFVSKNTTAYVASRFQKEQTPVLKADEVAGDFKFGPYTGRLPVTSFFSIRQENADGPALADARLVVSYRSDRQSTEEILAESTTGEDGTSQVTIYLTKAQRSQGEFVVEISKGPARKVSTLPGFLENRTWSLYVPAPSPLAERARMLVEDGQFVAAANLVWPQWAVAGIEARELFVQAARQTPDWWGTTARQQLTKIDDPATAALAQITIAATASRTNNQTLYESASIAAIDATKRIRDPLIAAQTCYEVARIEAELGKPENLVRACRQAKLALDGVPKGSGGLSGDQWERYILTCRLAGLCHRAKLGKEANVYLEQAYQLIAGDSVNFYYDFAGYSLIIALLEAGDLEELQRLSYVTDGEVRLGHLQGSRKFKPLGDPASRRSDQLNQRAGETLYETQCQAQIALVAARSRQENLYLTHRRRVEALLNGASHQSWHQADLAKEQCYMWLIQADALAGQAENAATWLDRLPLKSDEYRAEAMRTISRAWLQRGDVQAARKTLAASDAVPQRILTVWDIAHSESSTDLLATANWIQTLAVDPGEFAAAMSGTELALITQGNSLASSVRGLTVPAPTMVAVRVRNNSTGSILYLRPEGAAMDDWIKLESGQTNELKQSDPLEYFDGRQWVELALNGRTLLMFGVVNRAGQTVWIIE